MTRKLLEPIWPFGGEQRPRRGQCFVFIEARSDVSVYREQVHLGAR